MNRNSTAIILTILAIGIYFTFTRGKLDELKAVRAVNAEYQTAIDNAARLTKVRDDVSKAYNNLSDEDKGRLDKIVPDNVDNVRLIIDVKDDIAARHGLFLKNIRTSSPTTQTGATAGSAINDSSSKYGTVTLSFSVTTTYEKFLDFLRDIEASLRIMDVSKLSIATNSTGTYDFTLEIKTYWLRQ